MAEININLRDLDIMETCGKYDPSSRLHGNITINGIPHHLEAVAVYLDDEDCQVGVTEECEDVLSGLYVGCGEDAPFNTVEYRGRKYVFFMTPSN